MKKILSEKIKKKNPPMHIASGYLNFIFFLIWVNHIFVWEKNPHCFAVTASHWLSLSSLSHTGTLMNSLVYTYATLRSFCTSSFLIQTFKGFAVSFDTRFSPKKNKSCFPDETRQGIFQLTAFPWFYKRLLIRYPFLPLLFFHFLLIIST